MDSMSIGDGQKGASDEKVRGVLLDDSTETMRQLGGYGLMRTPRKIGCLFLSEVSWCENSLGVPSPEDDMLPDMIGHYKGP